MVLTVLLQGTAEAWRRQCGEGQERCRWTTSNGVARIFCDLSVISISGPRSLGGGGGGVAEISRDLPKPGRLGVGGGGAVAEMFRDFHKRTTFAGGGSGRKFVR